MPWNANLTNLKYVLADLYFLKEDSVPIVRAAGLSLAQISFSNKATTNWSNILDEADKRGKVSDVIRAALKDYSDNEFLKSALTGTLTPVRDFLDDSFKWESPASLDTLEKLMDRNSTLLPISWLAVGLQRARSVARVRRNDGLFGTGFLIKDNLFLTNHHVLPDPEVAKAAVIQFHYERNEVGLDHAPVNFELDPAAVFFTSQADDWTFVRVKGEAGAEWGFIELNPVEVKQNDRANIIQHPGGETKQIAVYHNIIAYADQTRVQYLTDTLPGSSGSPVFNSEWQLIALHHSGGSLIEPGSKKPVYRNEGVNINCILKGLAEQGLKL